MKPLLFRIMAATTTRKNSRITVIKITALAVVLTLIPLIASGQTPALRVFEPEPSNVLFGGPGAFQLNASGSRAYLTSVYGGAALVDVASGHIDIDLTELRWAYDIGGLSGDGNVLLAQSNVFTPQPHRPYRFVRGVGMEPLAGFVDDGNAEPRALSFDGSVVVGFAVNSTGFGGAFRWQAGRGVEYFDHAFYNVTFSGATAVSADGSSILVGHSFGNTPPSYGIWRGGHNNADLEVDPLGRTLSISFFNRTGTRLISALSAEFAQPAVPVGLGIWDAAGHLTTIDGPLGFNSAELLAANTDLSLVGLRLRTANNQYSAFLWSEQNGFVDINQLLHQLNLSLPALPGDYVISTITSISDDGHTIAGQLYGGVPYLLTIPAPSVGVLLGGA